MLRLEDLEVYQLAEKFSDMVWWDFDKWDKKVQNTVGYQLIRSSDSISANISEGYGRFTPADRKRFYLYARGSFSESKTWVDKLKRRDIISDERGKNYDEILNELGPKLNAFINKTR